MNIKQTEKGGLVRVKYTFYLLNNHAIFVFKKVIMFHDRMKEKNIKHKKY
jgi:hypothetical protein